MARSSKGLFVDQHLVKKVEAGQQIEIKAVKTVPRSTVLPEFTITYS